MVDLVSPSVQELAERRRTLRRQRRVRNLQSLWRIIAVSGMAVGTLWWLTHPFGILHSSEQITVEGNELLSDAAIRALLPLNYPQPLLEVETEQLAEALQEQAPVIEVVVTRELFPPRLQVRLQERRPIALTVPTHPPSDSAPSRPYTPAQNPGLLDAQGFWLPQARFVEVEPQFELPALQVRGFQHQYQAQWQSLYASLVASPITVSEIDWRTPSNMILQTELGIVHLGVYTPPTFEAQLATLERLRSLATTNGAPDVEYIDLSNPQSPTVKIIADP
ncbi:MAG: FtsQ-type POTRA domain-containing protein [Cyanobacteria bacterium J06638_28]